MNPRRTVLKGMCHIQALVLPALQGWCGRWKRWMADKWEVELGRNSYEDCSHKGNGNRSSCMCMGWGWLLSEIRIGAGRDSRGRGAGGRRDG